MKLKKLKIADFKQMNSLSESHAIRGGRQKMSHSNSGGGSQDWASNCGGKWDDVKWYRDSSVW